MPLGGYVAASPAVAGDRAFVGSFENQVLAVDLARRQASSGATSTRCASSPSMPRPRSPATRSSSAAGTRWSTPSTRRRGKELWTFSARSAVDASPVVAGNRVFAAAKSGAIFALDLEDRQAGLALRGRRSRRGLARRRRRPAGDRRDGRHSLLFWSNMTMSLISPARDAPDRPRPPRSAATSSPTTRRSRSGARRTCRRSMRRSTRRRAPGRRSGCTCTSRSAASGASSATSASTPTRTPRTSRPTSTRWRPRSSCYAQMPAIGGRPFRFVYFGGGTPSYLSVRQLEGLVVAPAGGHAVGPAPRRSPSSASRARSPARSSKRSAASASRG